MIQHNPLRVLMISTDRNIFREGSEARARMLEYGTLVKELHIIIFSKRSLQNKSQKISENVWLYSTSSRNRWLYVRDAVRMAVRLFFVPPEATFLGFTIGISEKLIDLITTQDPFETGLAGYFAAKKIRVPLHLQVHTDVFNTDFSRQSFLNKIRVRIARFLLPRASGGIRAVSERTKENIYKNIQSSFRVFPRIDVLPVFVDTEKFRNTPPSFSLHEKYPQFTKIVLAVSRLEEEKNIPLILNLLASVPESKTVRIGLVIVGGGSKARALQKQAERLGIEERVIFEGWQNDLISYYKTADILVVSSRYEGYGRVIVEAALSGCPILSFDVGIASEVLTYWNGSLCPAGDGECMRRNFLQWVNEPHLAENLLVSARGAVRSIRGETKKEYLKKYQEIWENAAQ